MRQKRGGKIRHTPDLQGGLKREGWLLQNPQRAENKVNPQFAGNEPVMSCVRTSGQKRMIKAPVAFLNSAIDHYIDSGLSAFCSRLKTKLSYYKETDSREQAESLVMHSCIYNGSLLQ